jgi:hypothetical protein
LFTDQLVKRLEDLAGTLSNGGSKNMSWYTDPVLIKAGKTVKWHIWTDTASYDRVQFIQAFPYIDAQLDWGKPFEVEIVAQGVWELVQGDDTGVVSIDIHHTVKVHEARGRDTQFWFWGGTVP